MEYWFKRWPNDIVNYSKEERFTLATPKTIKHSAILIQVATRNFIYANMHSFTQIAMHPELRSPKAAHYLIIMHTYFITFQTKADHEFNTLNEQLSDTELLKKLNTLTILSLARFFRITVD